VDRPGTMVVYGWKNFTTCTTPASYLDLFEGGGSESTPAPL